MRQKSQRPVKIGKADWNAAELWRISGSEAVNGLTLLIKETGKVVPGFFPPEIKPSDKFLHIDFCIDFQTHRKMIRESSCLA